MSRLAALAAAATLAGACAGAPDGAPTGADIFRVAVSGAPGGAFLSAWVPPMGGPSYVVGGYVAVDPAEVPAGAAGRLVRYADGAFTTVCRTPRTLWWVQGIGDAVWASGEDGIVLRYTPADQRCATLDLGGSWPDGLPTLWGLWGSRGDDVYLVGGSARPGGPRGVLLRFDGEGFSRVEVPEAARDVNLYKIGRDRDRIYVVGARATLLMRDDAGGAWSSVVPAGLGADDALFTVSCARAGSLCAAVGGAGGGRILLRTGFTWEVRPESDGLPGLNGVWVEHDESAFIVGQQGTTLHFNGRGFYRPPRALTTDTLHAVAGNGALVIAVGGEIGNASADQRGTILVRGDASASYALDGVVYRATGEVRPRLGDARGQ
ncbi:MAG: hypothetical protein EPO40_00555 [Myxococcaceae bacterium]|nr:MAG: hypothetical protein EPO40_00555 [Myxococcaceae bacterium]